MIRRFNCHWIPWGICVCLVLERWIVGTYRTVRTYFPRYTALYCTALHHTLLHFDELPNISRLLPYPHPASHCISCVGIQVHESKGSGDTFDVSWSQDATMLCACFSSGLLQVLDYSSVLPLNSVTVPATAQIVNGTSLS